MYLKRFWKASAAFVLFCLIFTSIGGGKKEITVNLGYASYFGDSLVLPGFTTFRGIKYASAERFKLPQEPMLIPGLQAANDGTTACPQGSLNMAQIYGSSQSSEDCLLIDIYTPYKDLRNIEASNIPKLPVLFWIHGGSYQSTSRNDFSPSVFKSNSNFSFVFVAINYRLSAFGFLSGAGFLANGGIPNLGLHDQNFALRWVQKNIAKFGGNPRKVILCGESAGAGSVLQQAVSSYGEGLFEKIWAASVFLPPQPPAVGNTSDTYYSQLLQATDCSRNVNEVQKETHFSCLRDTSIEKFQQGIFTVSDQHHSSWPQFLPVIDGDFIIINPLSNLSAKQIQGMSALVGSNLNEGVMFLPSNNITGSKEVEKYISNLYNGFTDAEKEEVLHLYPSPTPTTFLPYTNEAGRLATIIGDSIFRCPSNALASAFDFNAFRYEFAVNPAQHGQDLVYFFDRTSSYNLYFGDPQPKVQLRLVSAVMKFLVDGVFPPEGKFTSFKENALSFQSAYHVSIPENINNVPLSKEIHYTGVKEKSVSVDFEVNKLKVCAFWNMKFDHFVY